jgi:hypothetical protein
MCSKKNQSIQSKDKTMSNTKNETVKTTITMEQLAEMMQNLELKMATSHDEIVQGQEKTALNLQSLDGRMTKLEGMQPKLDTEAKLDAAVEAVKPGLLGGLKQASTTKKVVIATVSTAAVAGVAYGGYKGYQYMQERKAADLPLLAVEAVPSVSPAKQDALRQALK